MPFYSKEFDFSKRTNLWTKRELPRQKPAFRFEVQQRSSITQAGSRRGAGGELLVVVVIGHRCVLASFQPKDGQQQNESLFIPEPEAT